MFTAFRSSHLQHVGKPSPILVKRPRNRLHIPYSCRKQLLELSPASLQSSRYKDLAEWLVNALLRRPTATIAAGGRDAATHSGDLTYRLQRVTKNLPQLVTVGYFLLSGSLATGEPQNESWILGKQEKGCARNITSPPSRRNKERSRAH